tara:strand:- start:458 stop:1051 length:594 start_codon:yes stop_codon:yes gene_type:complete
VEEISLFLNSIDFNWSWIETFAVAFSISYVVLAAKGNIWCWFFAILSVSIYIFLCYEAKLFAETILQIFYLIMAFIGYFTWNNSNEKFTAKQLSISNHILIILSGAIITFLIGFYLATYTEAKMPIIDSFTTCFSIIATFLVIRKILENWVYWIIIDLVSIYIYFSRDLHLTSLLFLVYTVIAIIGYFNWKKKLQYD